MDWGWIVAGLIWALPVIEALTDWDALVEASNEASEEWGVVIAVTATLLWPVTCLWAAIVNVTEGR